MRLTLPAVLLTCIFIVGCEPPAAASVQLPIVDGTLETGEDAVVAVTVFGAVGLCTGTLIAPNVVLTAKHCVQASGQDGPYPITAFTVGVGSQIGETRDYRVRYVDTTPGVYNQSMTTGLSGEIFGVDVALLILREPVVGVTPIPIRRDRPDDRVGQPFTAIGFGQRPDGAAGTKYKTEGTVGSVGDDGIIFTAQVICSGDSGGPMIQETPERRLIGVASFGQAGACPSSRDGYNAVWNHLGRIDRAIVLSGSCLGLDEVCNSIDDDCDGTVDEGCVAFGESCTASSDCAHAQLPDYLDPLDSPVGCIDLGDGPVCTRPCDPVRPVATCAALEGFDGSSVAIESYHCRRDGCAGFCAPGAAGDAPDGTSCEQDTECGSLLCSDPGDGDRRCLLPCRPGHDECPTDEVCVGGPEGCGGCVSAGLVTGGRSLGERCDDDSMCGETCLDGYCTVACSAVAPCRDGFRCQDGVCHRGAPGGLGDPCGEDAICGGGTFCAEAAGRGWCAATCEDPAECGELECETVGGDQLCTPSGSILGEACDGECLGGVCEGGRCTRACGAGAHCPSGFECSRGESGEPRCTRISSGCAVSGPGGDRRSVGVLWVGLLGGLGLLVFRRGARPLF